MRLGKTAVDSLPRTRDRFLKFSKKTKVIILVIIVGLGALIFFQINKKSAQPQYQTAQVERGTLVVSTSVSGQVSSTNSGTISTQATGVVANVYVKNGDTVNTGDQIAQINLDLPGQQNAAQALSSLQSAQNNLSNAQTNFYTLQATMFGNWQTFFNLATNSTYQNADGSPNTTNRTLTTFTIPQDTWLAAEAQYKNQQNVVTQAQTAVNAASLAYQQSSPIIYAPIPGKVTGLSLQVGSVIASSGSSNSGTSTSQSGNKVASIFTDASPLVTLNLTEIDVTKVKEGDKATVTFDAIPDKTFTGEVVSIDTVGSIASGVTSYPTVIKIDTAAPQIHPNMSAQASIITDTRDGVLLVPASAVQTQNGGSYIRVLKNGRLQQLPVMVGESNDTQTEITSGVTEGQTIVTSVNTATTGQSSTTTSPFGALGGSGGLRGGFGGGTGRAAGGR